MPLSNTIFSLSVGTETSGTVTRSTVAVPDNLATAAVLLAANANRKGATVYNNSVGNVLIEFGAAPTLTGYAAKVNPNGYYELPYGFTGEIQGLWDAAGGSGVLIREFS